jgi:alkylation response protein AidB-like acyl-CoA dehydrogenase
LFSLHLTPEQLEFRDTIRDFVKSEVHPVAIHSDRLQPFEKPLLLDLLDDASRMGLRTLALSENAGGAGADTMTSCIVLEELAVGDVDLAMVLGISSQLGAALFDHCVSAEQRAKFLPAFLDERRDTWRLRRTITTRFAAGTITAITTKSRAASRPR